MKDPKQMTWDDIRGMIAETTKLQKETDRRMQETDRLVKETSRQMKESGLRMDKMNREANERLDKLGKHLGGVS